MKRGSWTAAKGRQEVDGGDAPVAKARGEDIRLSMVENEEERMKKMEGGAVVPKPNPNF